MSSNCLVIVSKNEGENPTRISSLALDTGSVDKVIVSECYDSESIDKSPQLEIRRKYFEGKGAAIIDGGTEAVRQGFDNIAFMDGDLKSVDKRWFPLMFESLEQADLVKASFLRNAKDAQITRHVTRPLIAMYFPEIWRLDQPLGGELSVKREVLKELFSGEIKPPTGWGIDTFITAKTCALGYTTGEVFLGEKTHGKKDLNQLRAMFCQCLMEMQRMIEIYQNRERNYKKELFVELPSPFKRGSEHKEDYMNPKKVFEDSLAEFSQHDGTGLLNGRLFHEVMDSPDYDTFFENTKKINADLWIETIDDIRESFKEERLFEYYLCWKVRALAFCLHESATSKEAEENTILQARKAVEYGKTLELA